MHKLGLVHADVKLENFAISHTATAAAGSCHSLSSSAGSEICSNDRHKVYLLDMGFAHPWQGEQHGLSRLAGCTCKRRLHAALFTAVHCCSLLHFTLPKSKVPSATVNHRLVACIQMLKP